LREGLDVPAPPVQRLARDVRRVDEVVPVLEERLLEELLDRVADQPALRVPVDQPRPDLLVDAEDPELASEAPVVATLRLLEPLEVFVEVTLREPRRAVDSLEHLTTLVAPPVRARSREEAEVLQVPRRRDVGPAAEVEERPVPVDRDDLVVAELFQALELERVVREELSRLVLGHDLPLEGVVAPHDLLHLLFDPLQFIRREGLRDFEIV